MLCDPQYLVRRRSEEVNVRRHSCVFFLMNIALMLTINSTLAPCLRMITLCCATDSELFQAQ